MIADDKRIKAGVFREGNGRMFLERATPFPRIAVPLPQGTQGCGRATAVNEKGYRESVCFRRARVQLHQESEFAGDGLSS